ncbi:MAG: hypothetical protein AMXMBFR64_20490 [Myxococcales bacterium]
MSRAPVLATIAALWALSPLPASGEPVPEPLALVPSGPVTVIVGQTLELQASGGTPPYTWISLDPGVGVVDDAGVFLAVGAGSSSTTQVLVLDAVSCTAVSGEITVPKDSDGDGLPDTWELAHGLLIGEDDAAADADGDGATNAAEWGAGSTPTKADTDGDGMPDGWEIINGLSPVMPDGSADPDGDGLDNLREYLSGHDPHMSDAGIDTDGDGMDDVWEINHGLDPASPADAAADPDGDGLVNGIERLAGTSPHEANEHLPDADGDWMPDPWEIAWGTDPLVADHFVDADGDGFPHYLEYLLGTDPFGHNGALTDTDGDGMPDQWERTFALDPAVDDGDLDADADGRPNRVEYRGATNPAGKDADVDGDGMADRWEHGFAVSDPLGNPDNDHLSNVEEFNKGKNPQVLNPYTVGVDPSTAALEVGEQVTLACTNAIGPCTWTSDAPGVATVAGGVVSGVAPGVALVTARDSNEIKGIGVVAVRESPVAGQPEPVGVHPTSAALVEGGRLAFAAFGGVRPYGAITSSDPAVVAVEADLDTAGAPVGTGWLAAGHAGQATVTVNDGGGATATITVSVAAGVVTVSPPSLSLAVGESAGLWATGAAPLTFQSADSAVATVGASTGKVTAVAAGVTQVVVTDAFQRQAVVDVTVENPVLILAPEELTLAVGAGVALVAVGGVPPYSWASSDPAVSVEAGYALAVASGAAVVTVTDSAGQKATATVTVAAASAAEGCGAAPAGPAGVLPVLAALAAVLVAVRLTFGPRRRRVGAPD